MHKEKEKNSFDTVIVLGGGLHKHKDKYYPTDYRHDDEFGMLGAGMRMVAAVDLYLKGKSNNFMFCTGVTEKNRSKYGDNVPTESSIYKNKFFKVIENFKKREDYKDKINHLNNPVVIEENKSFSTLTNIKEVFQAIKNNDWHNVAIISSDYHIPRVKALYEQALKQHKGLKINIKFLSAEEIVKKIEPGKYNHVIDKYYNSDKTLKRIENEERGLQHIRDGSYSLEEFQLTKKSQKRNKF